MNIAMNENSQIAYERLAEALTNIKISRDDLVDANEVLNYIRSSYFPELVVYSHFFAGIDSPAPLRYMRCDDKTQFQGRESQCCDGVEQ